MGHRLNFVHVSVLACLSVSVHGAGVRQEAVRAASQNNSKAKEDTRGQTALHRAAILGDVATVKSLQKDGADLTATDDLGRTPVHYAAMGGHAEVLAAFEFRNFPVGVAPVDRFGWTPLHMAASRGFRGASLVLARLMSREYSGEKRIGLDQQTRSGKTALQLACRRGDPRLPTELLDLGANATIRDLQGWTAMDFASASDHGRLMKRLVKSRSSESAPADAREQLPAIPRIPDISLFRVTPYSPADPHGTEIAVWRDGVVLFAKAPDPRKALMRVGRITTERLEVLRAEIEETGICDLRNQSFSRQHDSEIELTVRMDNRDVKQVMGERNESDEPTPPGRRSMPGGDPVDYLEFEHAWILAIRALRDVEPDDLGSAKLFVDQLGKFRGLEPAKSYFDFDKK